MVVRLEPIGRFPGLRVVAWVGGLLYAGRGYTLLRWEQDRAQWRQVAAMDPGGGRRLTVVHRLTLRLFRDGYHALAGLPDGRLAAVFPGVIGVLPPGASYFLPSCKVPRGTRPLALAATPAGHLFWGEYFDNARRDAVHVYGSADGGVSWEIVYTFPPGAIRHVHSVIYDAHAGCLWVLTGDEGSECRILRVSLDWSSVDTVLAGGQQTRLTTLVPRADAVYFATDTPFEENHIYRLARNGHLECLGRVAGSSFWGCGVDRALFFSTAVEPSAVNIGAQSILYGSANERRWTALVHWTRDRWPSRFFQYPNIILPAGENRTDVLAATGVAVRGEDQVTHLWRVHTRA